MGLVLGLALLKIIVHLIASPGYGLFRDELYFIVCGWRLDFGYVDQPPLVPLLARIGTTIFGVSAPAIRIFALLVGAALMVFAALMAREFGGRRFAQVFAAVTVLLAPSYIAGEGKLATDSIEPLFWMGCAYALTLVIARDNPRLWLWFGFSAGLGLQEKHSIVFFGFTIVLGLLLTPQRRLMWNRWFFAAGAIAFLIFLPNLLWEVQRHWPTLELLNNIKNSGKNVVLSPVAYFLQQILLIGPLAFPVWMAGLGFFFFHPQGRRFRVFGWSYLLTFAIIVGLKGKNYYLVPIYPVLLAGGAVLAERLTEGQGRRWMRPAYVTLMALLTIAFLPMLLPILPPDVYLRYQKRIGFEPPRTERSHSAAMPQHFADCFGWRELADNVAKVYQSLPPEDRAKAGIFAQNYGEAGAIDVYGRNHGLPPALSGHQNYFFWGTHGYTGEVLIVVDDSPGSLPEVCSSVQEAGPAIRDPYAMPFENVTNIYICRGMKPPLNELWPKVKRWM